MPPKKLLSTISSTARTLLFPPRCAACGALLDISTTLAVGAPRSLRTEALCPLCRTAWEAAVAEAAVAGAAGQSAADADLGLVYLTFYRSGHGEGVPERLIYHLKQGGDPRAFAFVARQMTPSVLRAVERLSTRALLDGAPEADSPDGSPLLFTYPPRRPSAVRRTGCDQAARLAKALAASFGGDFVPLIRRIRQSARAQKELDSLDRADNAQRTYELIPRAAETVRGRTVVICDDISTTGATLNRCADLLAQAGAAAVLRVAIAKNHSA